MKRPKGIYFIIIWFFLTFAMQMGFFSQIVKAYKFNNQNITVLWQLVGGGLIVFLIWTIVGLFRLQTLSRWITIVFFAACTMMPMVKIISNYSSFDIKIIVLLSVFLIPNILSIGYLLSQRFIRQSEEFRKEKAQNRLILQSK
jgi:hypothetical protein